VRAHQVVDPGVAVREEFPLVGEEPQAARQDEVVDEGGRDDGRERQERGSFR
jgi:hypothetical protein